MNESREALAHQRLAARLLALRTQQLENKLSRVSHDGVTPSDVSCLDESNDGGDKFAQVSEKYATANSIGSLQESNGVEDKLSPMSDNSVTPTDISRLVENNGVESSNETREFSNNAGNIVSNRLMHYSAAADAAFSSDVALESGSLSESDSSPYF